jgi:hypothetical protein
MVKLNIKKSRLAHLLLAGIGFILSPLSWWNDLVVNIPMAYIFSYPFAFINEKLFLPSFILGYWLTNLLGFLLLHWGGKGLLFPDQTSINIKHTLLVSLFYTAMVIILVLLGWLESPTSYLEKLDL